MQNTIRRRSLFVGATAAMLFAVVACGNNPTGPSAGGGSTIATLTSVTVTGASSVTLGQTEQLKAVANKSDGTQQDVTSQATWQSSDTSIASVSSTGVLSTIKTGSVTVTASYSGKSGSTPVSVKAKQFSLRVTLDSFVIVSTCDDFTQGLTEGEYTVKFTTTDPGGNVTTLYATTGYPGNPSKLYVLPKKAAGAVNTINTSKSYSLPGQSGQYVKVQFRATEWDTQIVLIPPSTRWVRDGSMNDRSTTRTHSYASGTFGSLGANTLTLGSGNCRIQAKYQISAQ